MRRATSRTFAGSFTFGGGAAMQVTPTVGSYTIRLDGHGLVTGDGPLTATTTGVLPAGSGLASDRYAVPRDANHFDLADSYAHALAGTKVTITGAGTGVHTLDTSAAYSYTSLTFEETFTADAGTDELTIVGHGLNDGDGPLQASVDAPVSTIYDQASLANVDTFIDGKIGAGTFTPIAGYSFDVDGSDFGAGGYDLTANGAADVTDSPHGKAGTEATTNGFWQAADATVFEFGTSAFAFVGRILVNAKPGGNAGFVAKGSSASAHYQVQITATGTLRITAKESGAASVTAGTVDLEDAWVWFAAGRSVSGEVVWCTTDGDDATPAALTGTKDLTNGAAIFEVGDGTAGGGVASGVDCEIDHLLVFSGAAAEAIYTNRVALVAALEADEAGIPGGLAALTDYYAISTGADTIRLAASRADAIAGTEIDLTSAGAGTLTLTATGSALHLTPVALGNSTFTAVD